MRLPPSAAAEVDEIIELMFRRLPAKPRAPVTSRKVDADLAAQIRAHQHRHPRMSLVALGEHFGVNPGRVSEALHHLR